MKIECREKGDISFHFTREQMRYNRVRRKVGVSRNGPKPAFDARNHSLVAEFRQVSRRVGRGHARNLGNLQSCEHGRVRHHLAPNSLRDLHHFPLFRFIASSLSAATLSRISSHAVSVPYCSWASSAKTSTTCPSYSSIGIVSAR